MYEKKPHCGLVRSYRLSLLLQNWAPNDGLSNVLRYVFVSFNNNKKHTTSLVFGNALKCSKIVQNCSNTLFVSCSRMVCSSIYFNIF